VETTVKRALGLIEQGALDEGSVSQFAERLGVSDRYLRQLFQRYVGASPKSVARSRRVLAAKRMISDSNAPMTAIAHQSGFRSIRQFNDTFRKLYGVSPSELRKQSNHVR